MTIPMAEIDLPPSATSERLYCPVCGAPVFGPDAAATCRHVVFLYIDAAGEFDVLAPHLARFRDRAHELAEDSPDPVIEIFLGEINKQIEFTTLFCLCLTVMGVTHAPWSQTAYVGIDFNPPSDEGESGAPEEAL